MHSIEERLLMKIPLLSCGSHHVHFAIILNLNLKSGKTTSTEISVNKFRKVSTKTMSRWRKL